ncbi:hypothetical protein K435DRAFT_841023 [Dendrothele bispora CBS 962.96]|uniref:MYND-type domain-containing protein n=1 Tax=Dendrothele bispora (strain CBS 962.96) TaxID=1314807 RepID=A0A4S8LPV4_DENBC|nr:hypothetical protein K435DRAFT_841023 [Dendrothele bispora CBS 962.96]
MLPTALPKDPTQALQALRDHPKSVRALGLRIPDDPSLFPALATIISYVARTPPPEPTSVDHLPSRGPNFVWVVESLEALVNVIKYTVWDSPPAQKTIDSHVQSLREHVPGVWLWISYIIDQYIDRDAWEENTQLYQDYSLLCFSLVANLMRQDPWKHSLIERPDFTPKLTRVFLRTLRLDPSDDCNDIYLTFGQESIQHLWKDDSWTVQKDKVVEILKEDLAKTTSTVLGSFARCDDLSSGGIHLESMERSCFFLALCCSSDWVVYAELLKHGAARWMALLISKLCRQLPTSTHRKDTEIASVLRNSFEYICRSTDAFGYKVLEIALQHGLLTSMFQYLIYIAQRPRLRNEQIFRSVKKSVDRCLDLLALFTAHVAIVRSVDQAMVDVKRVRHLDYELENLLPMGFSGSMLTFMNAFSDRMWLLEQEAKYSYKFSMKCSNQQCQRVDSSSDPLQQILDGGNGTTLRRCTGCYDQLYCSEQCQKKCWKEGHREECKAIVRADDQRFERLPVDLRFFVPRSIQSRQNHFQVALVNKDIRRHHEKILKLFEDRPILASTTAQVPITAPILKLDYARSTEHQPEISKICWGDIKQAVCGDGPPGQPGNVVVTSLKNPKTIPVFAMFPCGTKTETVTNAFWFQSVALPTSDVPSRSSGLFRWGTRH